MGMLPTVNEDCVVPAPNNISSSIETDELEDSPSDGRVNTIGKSSSYARCYVQNQELEIPAIREFGESSRIREFGECSRTRKFGESSRYGFQIEQRSTEFHSISFIHGTLDIGLNHNPRSDNVKDNKTRQKEIPLERILMSQNMTLVDAAKQLDVSRSTLKRRLKEYGLEWPSSRKRKRPQDAKSKKQNTKSPHVGKDSSLLNLVDPAILEGDNLSVEQFMDIQDQLALTDRVCDVPPDVDAALRKVIQDLSLSTSLSSIKQRSSTFIVKATYNEDTIRFDFSLSSSIKQLKEEVRKRLDVDIGKIKMKYLDEDNEWILFKIISDLKDAQRFPNLTGSNIVKLLITSSES